MTRQNGRRGRVRCLHARNPGYRSGGQQHFQARAPGKILGLHRIHEGLMRPLFHRLFFRRVPFRAQRTLQHKFPVGLFRPAKFLIGPAE